MYYTNQSQSATKKDRKPRGRGTGSGPEEMAARFTTAEKNRRCQAYRPREIGSQACRQAGKSRIIRVDEADLACRSLASVTLKEKPSCPPEPDPRLKPTRKTASA